MPERIVVTGASGLIGTALTAHLRARGDEVVRLVRRAPTAPDEAQWDPRAGALHPDALDGAGAVVHLAGAGVGDKRWTPGYKQLILASRVDGTTTVAEAIAGSGRPIRLVSASAVGYYGSDRGEEILTEGSARGTGFLADVVAAWETATADAAQAGSPVALARTGLVMAPGAGAFQPLLRLGRLGLGGPLGSGRQFWPWVTLHDEVRALAFLVDHPEITGPVNLVGPDPLPQRQIAAEIGRQLGRPAILPAPAAALYLAVGEFAGDILGSQRVTPQVLLTAGFAHDHPDLTSAVAQMLRG